VSDDRIETIRAAAQKIQTESPERCIPPEYIGFAHYTERQIREYAEGVGITETYKITTQYDGEWG